jgi:hypothetical protein
MMTRELLDGWRARELGAHEVGSGGLQRVSDYVANDISADRRDETPANGRPIYRVCAPA